MGMQLKLFGALGLLGLGAYGMSEADVHLNYIQTSGTVLSVSTDCYIEAGGRKVVDQRTDQLAYMDCEIAPRIAFIHGHDATHIKRRHKVEYTYNSPVNGSKQTGVFSGSQSNVSMYRPGQNISVYAHSDNPGVSRL